MDMGNMIGLSVSMSVNGKDAEAGMPSYGDYGKVGMYGDPMPEGGEFRPHLHQGSCPGCFQDHSRSR